MTFQVGFIRISKRCIRSGHTKPSVAVGFFFHHGKLLTIHHFVQIEWFHGSVLRIYLQLCLSLLTFFGGNQDYTIGSLCTINSRGCGIL